jgi:DNA repair protein RadC
MITYTDAEQKVIARAYDIIAKQWSGVAEADTFDSPDIASNLIGLRLATYTTREAFIVVYLNSQHQRISDEVLFEGTLDGAAVYPRIIAEQCLKQGAAAVILGHNHPSGTPRPSEADKKITERIKAALGLLDIRVLDHIIVAGDAKFSFGREGLI